MEIKEIKDSTNRTKYNELANEIGAIFNTLDWINIFGDKIKLYAIYEDDGKLIGGFYLFKEKKLGLKLYRNPYFTPNIGPVFEIKAQSPISIMNKQKEMINLMAEYVDKLPHSIISVSLNKDMADTQPFIWRKFKVIPGYTYILDLGNSLENIQKEMSKERRNDINKAIKDGLIVRPLNDYETVKSLVFKTFDRQEKKINKIYLEKILFHFANKNNSFSFVVFDKEKPIAVAFCVYDKKTAYYLFGGYDNENKHHGAGALSVWESIKYAKDLGLRYFDFEGSMIPSIERYFRGFGGRLTPYYRINKARLPLEIILKFFKRELF